jgi:hypothetical protein
MRNHDGHASQNSSKTTEGTGEVAVRMDDMEILPPKKISKQQDVT